MTDLYLHHAPTGARRFFWDPSQPYPFDAPTSLDYGRVDPEIRELVRLINATGWMETVSSCAGHPERDNAYSAHVELWIRVPEAQGLAHLFDWIARADEMRRAASTVFKDERLIDMEYIGRTPHGWYFVIYGRFVSAVENTRIITALSNALY